jgi:Rrf2 family transcriptional regulator, nitric oxide-sensitive transcriptional repressor
VFSQTVEYALRAAAHLALHAPKSLTTQEISTVTLVPKPYLTKVLRGLAKGGILVIERGVKGGVKLARPPEEMTILDIVNAVEPIKRINTCPLGFAAHGANLCPLHRRMDAAMGHVEQALATSTLAEILAEPSSSVPLCYK